MREQFCGTLRASRVEVHASGRKCVFVRGDRIQKRFKIADRAEVEMAPARRGSQRSVLPDKRVPMGALTRGAAELCDTDLLHLRGCDGIGRRRAWEGF